MWPFNRRSGNAEPQVRVVSASPQSRIPKARAEASQLRRTNGQRIKAGMWVVYSDAVFTNHVGILTALDSQDNAEVMLVDDSGFNLIAVRSPAAALRQATYAEIPLQRRPTTDVADALGYSR